MRKNYLFLLLCLCWGGLQQHLQAQCAEKWRVGVGVGQYAATIGLPVAKASYTGLQAHASYQYNRHVRHQIRQSFHLGGFHHRYFQTALQLYTEFQYEWHLKNGLYIAPLALGGGYVASFSDMTTLKWNGTAYEEVKLPMRSNFLISLGPNLGYETPWQLFQRKLSFSLAYRLQVQGIVVRNTVPVVAYGSFQLGAALPLGKEK